MIFSIKKTTKLSNSLSWQEPNSDLVQTSHPIGVKTSNSSRNPTGGTPAKPLCFKQTIFFHYCPYTQKIYCTELMVTWWRIDNLCFSNLDLNFENCQQLKMFPGQQCGVRLLHFTPNFNAIAIAAVKNYNYKSRFKKGLDQHMWRKLRQEPTRHFILISMKAEVDVHSTATTSILSKCLIKITREFFYYKYYWFLSSPRLYIASH